MANTLTALAPIAYSAAKEVASEPFGLIDAINTTFDDKGVAVGDTIYVPVAPTRAATDFTPSMTPTAGTDATAATTGVVITASKFSSWNITGEQQLSLQNAQADNTWFGQLLKQGMRDLRNRAEADAFLAAKVGASRAYGTAGTTPFATDLSAMTNARKILQDNGAPLSDISLVVDTSASLNLRNLGIIQQAYQAGSDAERRSGALLRQFGFDIKESIGGVAHTKGTGASYTTSAAGFAVGTTSIPIITGTGTVVAGDAVTFAGDPNKYIIATGVAAPGTIVIAQPGLRVAIAASATAMTIGNNYTPNLAIERSAVVGIMRPPVMPANPIMSQLMVSDDRGMSYLLLDIAGVGMRTMQLHLCWGFKTVNPEFSAIVLG